MRASRSLVLAVALCANLALVACNPEHPCDPGYKADHGLCLREIETRPEVDGGEDDAGPVAGYTNDDRDFGQPCEKMTDCGGKAPVCGAPMLPLCTAVNCLKDESACPIDWTCLDISTWDRPDPEIKSICVRF